jgi:hypothetical protein
MPKLPQDFEDVVIEGRLIRDEFPAMPQNLEENIRILRRYVFEDAQRPILITGLNESGKTFLVRRFVSRDLPSETKVEWLDVDKTRNVLETIEVLINRLRTSESPERLLVVMDNIGYGSDGYLLVCKTDVTSGVSAMFEGLNAQCRFKYKYEIWQGEQFKQRLLIKPLIIKQYFPDYHEFLESKDGKVQ